jgi:tetratricopeptide (TPR) repeat protein
VIADEQAGQERYRTLETIREYARERLAEAGETRAVQERHHDWFLALAEQAAPEGYDTQGLASVGHEYDNLRAALRWAIDSRESERALRLAGGLWNFWSVRGFYTEGRAWLGEALALDGDGHIRGTRARARAMQAAGHLANCQGDYAAAADLLEESRIIAEELGDQTALGASLHLLGNLAIGQGELEQAGELFSQARELNRRSGNRAAEILNMLQLAEVAFQTGDSAQSLALGEEVLKASRERAQQWGVARSLHVLGRVATAEGDFQKATRLHQQSLGIQQELGDQQGQVRSLAALGRVAFAQGDGQLARERYLDSLQVARQSYELLEIARSLEGLAELYAAVEPERALRLAGAAGAMRKTIGAEPYAEELRRLNAWQQPVYVALGEKRCAEAGAAGRGMSLDQAIGEVVAGASVST